MNSTDNRKPAPRIVGWIGVALAVATIIMCLTVLTGCGCDGHGGTRHVLKSGDTYALKCNDGTWQ